MGQIGEAVNSVTSPFGVELFGGGTLSDNTADAMTAEARAEQEKQRDQWAWLGDYGRQFLTVPTAGGQQVSGGTATTVPAQTSDGKRMDAGDRRAYEQEHGLPSSMGQSGAPQGENIADVAGRYMSNLDLLASGTDLQQYQLNPAQQKLLNQSLGTLSVSRAKAVDTAKRMLADRGITEGPVYEATMRRISDTMDGQMMSTATQFAETARNQRMSDMYTYLQQLMAQSAYGTGLIGQAQSGGQQYANYLGNAAAAKQAEAQAASENLGKLIMFGLGQFPNALTLPGSSGVSVPGTAGGYYGTGYGAGGWGGWNPTAGDWSPASQLPKGY